MKKRYIIVWIFTVLLGGFLHELYSLLPLEIVKLFAPANESVWEHLKLLFWPFLISAWLLAGTAPHKNAFWSGIMAALLEMPVVLLGIYYLLQSGFGIESVAMDIVLYALVLAQGFCLAAHLQRTEKTVRWLGILVMLAGIYGAALILFSLAAPALPIFTPKG